MCASNSLTKQRTTPARVLRSMAWSLPFIVGYWAFRRCWQEIAILAVAFCYLAFYEAFSDRLAHRSRYLVVVPLFIGIIAAMLLLKLK